MAEARTERPFAKEVPLLLKDRGMSLRALARESGVSDAHLSRLIRGVGYRSAPSADLAARVARAFGLPVAYFKEYREKVVLDAVKRDAKLREELYERLAKPKRKPRPR